MRSRIAVPALLLAALVVAAASPAVGTAAPKHKHHLTITVVPRPIVFGDPVFIYGTLSGPNSAGRKVILYQRLNPFGLYSAVAKTRTNSSGFYSFTRTDVVTNREFFVRADHTRSVQVAEKVGAALTLTANPTTTDTAHPVTFSGAISPTRVHVGEHVYLQEQVGTKGDDWKTLKRGTIGPDSTYSIRYRFPIAGERDVRVLFRGDARNTRAASDVVTLTVKEAQRTGFTIEATPQVIDYGQSAVVSGVLDKPGTSTPDPGQTVQLWGHVAGAPYGLIGTMTTNASGQYSFTVSPRHNEVYQARTTTVPVRKSAQVLEVVRYAVSIKANKATARIGDTVTFTGNVAPSASGHVIYLQGLGLDHEWHTIKSGNLFPGSSYALTWKIGAFGPHVFRTLVPGDPANATGHSAAVTVTVTSLPVI